MLSNYEKEVSSIHQHLTEIIIVYGDYRYYREKVPYLKEGHLKAEEVWQKWISNSSNQDIAQKEIIELRADKVSIKDKDEKAKKIARFKENLKSWSEQGIEESREKLSNLFEKLLYREIFARGEISEEKRRILKR